MMPTHINHRYQIIRQLGEGGMGTVYLAYDPNTSRQVAIKVLPAEYLRDRNFQVRFKREIKITASLQLPAIVSVYDSGEDNGKPFIVMSLMRGGSLEDHLNQGQPSLEQIAKVLAVLASALDEVHKEGVIHRDLKPSNILFDEKGNPYIADFGLALHVNSTKLTESGSLLGTFAYMSPEQASNPSELDRRSDIYSLGGILFKMLTGKDPYHDIYEGLALLFHHGTQPPPRLNELRPDLSSDWQDIIDKAMAKKPEERYSTAKELSDAVQNMVYRPVAKQKEQASVPKQPLERQPIPNTLVRILLGIGLGFVVLGLFFALLWSDSTRQPTPTPVVVEPNATPILSEPLKDGMIQVYVADGEFMMGALDNDEDAFPSEIPQRTVYLDAYWIDQHEVTNGMYEQCVEAGACVLPPETGENRYANPDFIGYPVTNVSWEEASAYCVWAGRRLPTEAEWEKAARGADGRRYPWGNQEMADNLANFCDGNCELEFADGAIDDGYAETAPVGTYPAGASRFGALDMAGNVSEWVADWYDEHYYQNALARNPMGPQNGTERVLRGGSWFYEPRLLRTTYRSPKSPATRNTYSGFRCASTP